MAHYYYRCLATVIVFGAVLYHRQSWWTRCPSCDSNSKGISAPKESETDIIMGANTFRENEIETTQHNLWPRENMYGKWHKRMEHIFRYICSFDRSCMCSKFELYFFFLFFPHHHHRITCLPHISIKLCLCWHRISLVPTMNVMHKFHSWAHISFKRCGIWEYVFSIIMAMHTVCLRTECTLVNYENWLYVRAYWVLMFHSNKYISIIHYTHNLTTIFDMRNEQVAFEAIRGSLYIWSNRINWLWISSSPFESDFSDQKLS